MDWVQLISAAGLGAIITTIIQSWLANRIATTQRNFEEKKEAYVGLLQAYHEAAVENTDKAAKNFAYWQMRVELVSNKKVRKAVQDIVDSNENRNKRLIAHEKLKDAFRTDLGISL